MRPFMPDGAKDQVNWEGQQPEPIASFHQHILSLMAGLGTDLSIEEELFILAD